MAEGRILTYQTLLDHGACTDYSIPFADKFQESVLVTVELAVSQALDWPWDWAANEFLSRDGRLDFHAITQPANDEYRAVMEPHWEAEYKAFEAARTEYHRVETEYVKAHGGMDVAGWDAADKAYQAVSEPVVKARDAANAPATLKLQTIRARAFAELYIKEGNEE